MKILHHFWKNQITLLKFEKPGMLAINFVNVHEINEPQHWDLSFYLLPMHNHVYFNNSALIRLICKLQKRSYTKTVKWLILVIFNKIKVMPAICCTNTNWQSSRLVPLALRLHFPVRNTCTNLVLWLIFLNRVATV